MNSNLNEIEEIIDEESVKDAYLNIISLRNQVKTIDECFIFLSSVNLLNAYVKKDYALEEIKNNYKFKDILSEILEDIIIKEIPGVEVYYTVEVVYVKIKGYQFSFHYVKETDILRYYSKSKKNKVQESTRIMLQPIALSIFKESMN